jgi:hypothetical protein
VACIVTRQTTYAGYNVRFVIDAFGRSEFSQAEWSSCAWELVRHAATQGGPELLMILGNTRCGPLEKLSGLPFVRVPPRLLPQRVPLFAGWCGPAAQFDFSAQTLQFSLADCDMF